MEPDDGAPKMLVTARSLHVRRSRPGSLGPGGHRRLPVAGARSDHAIAFLRGDDVAVVAPRLVMGLANGWQDTTMEFPEGHWTDELTGTARSGRIELTELTEAFPVALLTRS